MIRNHCTTHHHWIILFYILGFYRYISIFLRYACCDTYKHLPFIFELKGRLPCTLFISKFLLLERCYYWRPFNQICMQQLRHDEDSTSNNRDKVNCFHWNLHESAATSTLDLYPFLIPKHFKIFTKTRVQICSIYSDRSRFILQWKACSFIKNTAHFCWRLLT